MSMVTPRSGFDLEYYLDQVGEKTAGGYYLNAAQEASHLAGGSAKALRRSASPTGRWWNAVCIWRSISSPTR